MANKLQIQRKILPDLDMRVYFSGFELTKKNAEARRGDGRPKDPVLATTLEIPGVALATITPYALMIIKAPTHEWDGIESSILRLLSAFNLGEGALEEGGK